MKKGTMAKDGGWSLLSSMNLLLEVYFKRFEGVIVYFAWKISIWRLYYLVNGNIINSELVSNLLSIALDLLPRILPAILA